jgi:hypothetical protein
MAEASFQEIQYALAAHIRDPQAAAAPEGIEDRRLAIYRDLFFNNLRDLLGRGFPVLRKIVGPEGWDGLIREFMVQHRCRTPLFLELPREFLTWLREQRKPGPDDPPFLAELAHYEWVELALTVDERILSAVTVDPDGDLIEGVPVVSPLAWSLAYRFPVHRVSPDFRPAVPDAEPTRLIVVRDRKHQIGFLEINAVTARLLELLRGADSGAEPRLTGRAALERVALELSHPNPAAVVAGGRDLLESLRGRDVVLGTRPSD